MKFILGLVVLLVAAGLGFTASAGTIYFDALNGSGALTGRAPTTRPGTETWTSAATFTADGVVANGIGGAFLPFTPAAGNRYVLSADMHAMTAGQNWLALGFTAANTTTVWYSAPNNGAPWMLLRGDRGTGQGQSFQGPITAGVAAHDTPAGVVNMKIVLDTTTTLWTVQWFVNGASVRGPVAYAANPTINYVGMGQNAEAGIVQNFTLSGESISNPSFERDTFANSHGAISNNAAISGWTTVDTGRAGLNPAGGANVMADNGAVPDGTKVAWLEPTNTLRTTLTSLTNGTIYTLRFRVNGKTGNTPTLRVSLDGAPSIFDAGSVAPVGGTAPYDYVALNFAATNTSHTLWITNDATGTNTLLLDNFSLNVSTSGWSYAIWTNDASAGVDGTKNYTHAYRFGNAAGTTINGIVFAGIGGNNPNLANSLSTAGLTGGANADGGNAVTDNGGGSAALAGNFIYNGNPAIFSLQGLVPGKQYVATFYSVDWDATGKTYGRSVTWGCGTDRLSVNQDQFGLNAGGRRNGIRVSYAYTAPASGSITVSNIPFSTAVGTLHTYGLANYEATAQTAPVIGLQPKSQVAVAGVNVSFMGTAGGATPLSYRWLKNGVEIPGQTTRVLTLTNVAVGDLAQYSLWVSNSYGMVTSSAAGLSFSGMIANPSFEADAFANPGSVALNYSISGWTNSAPAYVGLNPAGDLSLFADNGAIPNGNQVAFLNGGVTARIGTLLSGLTAGQTYTVSFRANAQNGQTANAHLALDGQSVLDFQESSVGGVNPYRRILFDFLASNSVASLTLTNDAGANNTLLVDDFQIGVSTSKWAFAAWTNDVSADVDATRVYTHAYNFGGAAQTTNTVLNGVTFRAVPNANPAASGWFWTTNFTGAFGADANVITTAGGGSAGLAGSFVYYGGANLPIGAKQMIVLSNLVPGVEYKTTLYLVAFGGRFGGRAATFSVGEDRMTINEHHFGDNVGMIVSCRYVADSTGTATIAYEPTHTASSIHTYGFSNYELTTTNKPTFYAKPSQVPYWIAYGNNLSLSNFLIGGQQPVSLQWRFNGTDMLNQTNAYLNIVNAGDLNAGTYTLVATNAQGMVTLDYAVNVGYITNPSFEADRFTVGVGYISLNFPITGWTTSVPANAGINPAASSPFADNGAIPDGSQVGFIQSQNNLSSLSTPISALVSGQVYTVSFRFNSRNNQKPSAHVAIDGLTYLDMLISSVGGTAPYKYASFDFMATNYSQTLSVTNLTTSDTTALIDDFRVNVSTSKWSFAAWNNDASSGVDATKNYSHAWHFGSANSTVISNITFIGSAGASPSPEIVGVGFTAAINNYSNTLTTNGGGSAVLGRDYVYAASATNQSLTITGLVPGVQYVAMIYSVGWSNDIGGKLYGRAVTFAAGTDRMTINQDQFGMYNGLRVSYTYAAPANGTMTFNLTPSDAASTLHLYGFANYEISSTTAPVVYHQPARLQYARTGGTAAFYAQAGGQGPLSIQWFKDGILLDGQTNLSLLLSGLSGANAGVYSVAITNALGGTVSSNATLVMDAIIANPSFEADTFLVSPGTVAANFSISGWTADNTALVGLNPAGGQSPYANNGTVPDGSQVAFLQGTSSLSTLLSGLTSGQTYTVRFRANGSSGQKPILHIGLDNQLALDSVVYSPGDYKYMAFDFTASNATHTLSLTNTASTALVDNFSIAVSTSKWSFAVWTNDTSSGVDGTKVYTHAYALGAGAPGINPVINGVNFLGVAGANPARPGQFASAGFPAIHTAANTLTANGGGSGQMGANFVYNGTVQTFILSNLVPGVEYLATVYGVAWDPPAAGRAATFVSGSDMMTINEDFYGQNNGIRVSYRYLAGANGTFTLTYVPTDTTAASLTTFHTHGFSNYELTSTNRPSFYSQPGSQAGAYGGSVTLAAVVGGQVPVAFQWQRNGVDLLNQTNASLTLSSLVDGNAGTYTLIASNVQGVVVSSNAVVSVGYLANPSFEVDTFYYPNGNVSVNFPITGWTALGNSGGVALNPIYDGTSAYANNGTIPDGKQVGVLGVNVGLGSYLFGLTIGQNYTVSYRLNTSTGADTTVGNLINGSNVVSLISSPVGGANAYRFVAFDFTATNGTMFLSLTNTGGTTVLLDDFRVNTSASIWSYAIWTNDATADIDNTRRYSHAFNFGGVGNANNFVLSGMNFLGVPGVNPASPGEFSSVFPYVFGTDANAITANGGGSASLARSFVYYNGGGVESITISNLVPGVEYMATIYGVNYLEAIRTSTFSEGTNRLTVNEGQFGGRNGIRVMHRYTADASGSVTLSYTPFNSASFHTYGFSNYELASTNAPFVYRQPTPSSLNAMFGGSASFFVWAGGEGPLTYQWKKDGVDLPTQTSRVLTLTGLTLADGGLYTVAVSNAHGGVVSSAATLNVVPAIVNPSFEVDLFTVYPGYISGNFLITGWTNTAPVQSGLNPAGGQSPFANNGVIPDGVQVAFLQVDGTMSQIISGFNPGSTYVVQYYENIRSGFVTPALAVKIGGMTVVPAHLVPAGAYVLVTSDTFVATNSTMNLEFVKSSPLAGDSTVLIDNVSIVYSSATAAPTITTQPAAASSVMEGSTLTLSLVARGNQPLSYQWQFNGADLSGQNSASLVLNPITVDQSGDYQCVITNLYGSVTSAVASVRVFLPISTLYNSGVDDNHALLGAGLLDPHYILTQSADPYYVTPTNAGLYYNAAYLVEGPSSRWISPDTNGSVHATLDGLYTFLTSFTIPETMDLTTARIDGKWALDNSGVDIRLNGVSLGISNNNGFTAFTLFAITNGFISGSNSLEFVISNSPPAGATAVRIEMTGMAMTNAPVPPEIVLQPTNTTLMEGQNAVFSVGVTGHQPFSYQWWYMGPLSPSFAWPDATNRVQPFPGVDRNQAGYYVVVVTNAYGAITSAPASLTVLVPVIGTVTLDAFEGLSRDGVGTRDVAFTATDGATFTNRFVQTLSFVGGVGSYSNNVSALTTRFSAKTAWTLRQRVDDPLASLTVDFALLGGDINGSNKVDIDDYYLLATRWYTSAPDADIDGSGKVDLDDYFILSSHWDLPGDVE